MNHITLIGRVARLPELRYTASGKAVASFVLAVDRKFGTGNNKETDFIPIVAWQRLAEICNEFLTKGKLIAIEGRLQAREYETQDGQKRKAFEVVASEMQMLDRPDGGRSGGGQGSGSFDREPVGVASGSGYEGFPDEGVGMDDIPF
ncbi:MAG: single-stranded DNA-binding protein [Armatimonadetes bacterium]|nr:single-stranded DNA-binding protein [Armatimonadota bacterium]